MGISAVILSKSGDVNHLANKIYWNRHFEIFISLWNDGDVKCKASSELFFKERKGDFLERQSELLIKERLPIA
jgi:hypothetical protein